MARRRYDVVTGLPLDVLAKVQEEFAVRDDVISMLRGSIDKLRNAAQQVVWDQHASE